MKFKLKAVAALIALASSGMSFAAGTGGYATVTGGGSVAPVTVSSLDAMQAAITAYEKTKTNSGLVLIYNGNEDALINKYRPVPCSLHDMAVREVAIKNTGSQNITIQGTDGSSAQFGIRIGKGANNIIVRNMTMGMIQGGSNNGDAFGVEGATNVWLDHNTLFNSNVDAAFSTSGNGTNPTQIWCPGTSGNDTAFDGLIDMKDGTTNVTVSYNYIHDHHKVGLDGSSDSDLDGNITFHHNYYSNVGARLPLQRGGLTHEYSNVYSGVTTSGINVRMGGQALIESNWFENALNVVTSRDSKTLGYWDLRNNNVTSPNDFGTYNITWIASTDTTPTKNADDWSTTKAFPGVSYAYTVSTPVCVKNNLLSVAGAGKGLKELTASCAGGTSSSSSSTATSSSSSSKASSSSSSTASSSSSSKASSSSSSSASGAPVLTGTGDYPDGFSKCADLGGTCSVSKGTGWVAFGRKGSWVTKKVTVGGSIACTVAAFGSEPNGNPDKCSTQN